MHGAAPPHAVRELCVMNERNSLTLSGNRSCFDTGLFEQIVGVLTTCHTQYS